MKATGTGKAVSELFQQSRGIDSRDKLLIRAGGEVKAVGVDQRNGSLVAINDKCMVVKWPGYSFNPGSKYSMLTTKVKTHVSVYLIDEVIEKHSSMHGNGTLVKCGEIIDYDTRPAK